MSQVPKPTLAAGTLGKSGVFAYGRGKDGGVELDLSQVEAMIGIVPPVVAALIVERNWDMIKHHRLGLLKDARDAFPGGRSAQRFIAAVMHGYGRSSKESPRTLAEATGEIFTASRSMRDLEQGGTINTRERMAVMFGPPTKARRERFREALKDKAFFITPGGLLIPRQALPGAPTLLPAARAKRTRKTEIAGVLSRRRRQRPLLGFQRRFDQNLPAHMAKLDGDLEKALTDAGQRRLATKFERDAFRRAERATRLAASVAAKATTKIGGGT